MTNLTFPQALVERARKEGAKVALREKDFGIWNEYTYLNYLEQVKQFALGLSELGLRRGDKLAIIGDNRPEWVISEIAAQSLGGVSVGIYQESLPNEISYIIDNSDACIVVVEDQEQVDKLFEIKHEIPKVRWIIYYDDRGMRDYNDPNLLFFKDVQSIGKKVNEIDPKLFEQELEKGKYEDVAILSYTSGTTGNPKGTMLTYQNLFDMAKNLSSIDPLERNDQYLSFLPLAWIGEQMMSIALGLYNGLTINFPEEPSTVLQNIREIGPHVMFSPPRIYEDMLSRFQVKIQDASWLKRKIYEWCKPIGEKVADAHLNNKTISTGTKIMYNLADYLMFSAIRDHLGLLRIKRAYTGGAPLGPDVFRFFHSIGVNVKSIYGQTEVSGISIVHRDGDIKIDSVGVALPGTMVKISEEGEILIKSTSVCKGYYKNEQSTKETIEDGWLRTGDAGSLDESGHLYIIDRVKDVIRLQTGEMFSPQFIENKLKFSQYIKEAVAIGRGRPYVVAMINIDMENVGRWAEKNQITYTTYTDLSSKEAVLDLIQEQVNEVNKALPEKARVKKFVLLYKELDADDEELTRTKKVRRQFVSKKYEDLIEGLYSENEKIDVQGLIKYRDGKQQTIRTTLQVISLWEEEVVIA
ncbi:AMP-forming long-chain acyl-CoA synthetase [Schinkia azotoformans MEV2011]|uniref:Acyl-CoA synthetase n=1 Tax=Schinkia azotoformans MEV2011 TaxID=1348973 RepID=A0A072NLW7_SCHAZ|nr:AMP-binding protein [Schinkia azotoformans]KEF38252.1 AMP-forming long-chain acyl-CoA synthetase [Schinkia azotoformans MEV2011]MEC1693996.1 AMP-binding protein [Schinkia azotoformans]MEC1715708.1 AMP-binding protein [Schinkia azotoformans]MEC1724999.1 AMP-binding protein [Schinkia azotoformans]MEC1741347.1 AMP-binding protein [Schinkia azotoformans]